LNLRALHDTLVVSFPTADMFVGHRNILRRDTDRRWVGWVPAAIRKHTFLSLIKVPPYAIVASKTPRPKADSPKTLSFPQKNVENAHHQRLSSVGADLDISDAGLRLGSCTD
jgi:hypothetical protein